VLDFPCHHNPVTGGTAGALRPPSGHGDRRSALQTVIVSALPSCARADTRHSLD